MTQMSPAVESLLSRNVGPSAGDRDSARGISAASFAIKVDEVEKRRGRRLGLEGDAAGMVDAALIELELGCVLKVAFRFVRELSLCVRAADDVAASACPELSRAFFPAA